MPSTSRPIPEDVQRFVETLAERLSEEDAFYNEYRKLQLESRYLLTRHSREALIQFLLSECLPPDEEASR